MNKKTVGTAVAVVAVGLVGVLLYSSHGSQNSASSNSSAAADMSTAMPADQGGDTAVTTATTTTTVATDVQTGTVKEFTVTGTNFAFAPSAITVNKGDTVKITFKNASGFHDFKIDAFNVATKQIPGGQEQTVQFVATKTGSFEYYCSVGKHRAMGMKGTLTVL